MRKLRVLVLVHKDLVPPETIEGLSDKEIAPWKAEYDVITTLKDMGHEVHPLGVWDELAPIRLALAKWKPHICFMMLEEFFGVGTYDQHIIGYLELMRQAYTGCNPIGLMLTHDKGLSKKILSYHRILTPRFVIFPIGHVVRRPKRVAFPLLVKSTVEDASLGIAQASIVRDDQMLQERVQFMHEHVRSDAIVEEYIEGRELYVGIIGNQRLQTFPIWEMLFTKLPENIPRIATAKIKWDLEYQKKYGIKTQAAKNLKPAEQAQIARLCKRAYRVLRMNGYGRMDLRLRADGRIFILEANANPNLEFGEDFAESAESTGISYEALLQRVINLGMRYKAPWQE